jgi:hypothetical protein
MITLTFEEFARININARRSCIYQQVAGDGSAGGSCFYTTEDAIIASQGSAEKLNNGLQRWEHPFYGPRNKIAIFQIIASIPNANSRALANPDVNEGAAFGGYMQIFVKEEDATRGLKPVGFIILSK